MSDISVSPSGETFPLPAPEEYAASWSGWRPWPRRPRPRAKKWWWSWAWASWAPSWRPSSPTPSDEAGRPGKFVIGCQRPSPRSFWKIPLLNRGVSPVKAEDPEVDAMIARCVRDKKTLTATYNSDCLALADCVVVDVQCDYTKNDLGDMHTGEVEMAALEATMQTIGEKIRPDCLVLIETTVAPGTTEFVAYPILKKAFQARGIESRAAAGPQLRAGHAGQAVRRLHPRLLAGVLGLQRRGHASGW